MPIFAPLPPQLRVWLKGVGRNPPLDGPWAIFNLIEGNFLNENFLKKLGSVTFDPPLWTSNFIHSI